MDLKVEDQRTAPMIEGQISNRASERRCYIALRANLQMPSTSWLTNPTNQASPTISLTATALRVSYNPRP